MNAPPAYAAAFSEHFVAAFWRRLRADPMLAIGFWLERNPGKTIADLITIDAARAALTSASPAKPPPAAPAATRKSSAVDRRR